jgi:heptosyltransferase I
MKKSDTDIESICIVRLSAIGDVTHMIPVIHSIQKFRPHIKITWIVGSVEHQLVGDLANVEFIQFNKKDGMTAYYALAQTLRGREFDAVLAMQVSLRANIITALINSKRKIGYDSSRSKDLHGLVINERITFAKEHVVDSFFKFIEQIGIPHRSLDWQIPIPLEAQAVAQQLIPENTDVLAISPCSSHSLRNWSIENYAQVANYAIEHYGMRIVLMGGRSVLEKEYGDKINALLSRPAINLIGKDTLKQLLATLQRVTVLLTPDSGPAHMASCVDTPVIALHAASNSQRSGPYLSLQWCVDKYSEAAQTIYSKSATQLKWGQKLEKEGVMSLIKVKDVIIKLDALMQDRK